MATVKSTQMATDVATKVKANERGGRVRVMYWSYTTPVGGLSAADVIELNKLPKGARVLHGRTFFEAMGGSGAVQIGIAGTVAKYLATTSVVSAGEADLANTLVLNMGVETAAEETVIATVTTGGWVAAKKFNGYILYAQD